MTDLEILTMLSAVVNDFGFMGLIAWMLLSERSQHENTRQDYRRDLRKVAKLHDPNDDE